MTKKPVNSRRKGKTGELEFARRLTELGYPASRGQQFKGGQDSPDVVCPSLPDIHWEVKRTKECETWRAATCREWDAQARRDAGGKLPIVAHRWNGSSTWVVRVLGVARPYWQTLEDFLTDYRAGQP